MGLSIAIDVTRSRALMKAAKKHGSQALEADALHFSTDVWSSSVVIAGLIAVSIGEAHQEQQPAPGRLAIQSGRHRRLGVSMHRHLCEHSMGRGASVRSWTAPRKGINATVERAVASLPGVVAVDRIRSRQSGPAVFVDMTLAVARTASLEESHSIASSAESAVQKLLPRSDVMVHIDPVAQRQQQPGGARACRRRPAGHQRSRAAYSRRARQDEPRTACRSAR